MNWQLANIDLFTSFYREKFIALYLVHCKWHGSGSVKSTNTINNS